MVASMGDEGPIKTFNADREYLGTARCRQHIGDAGRTMVSHPYGNAMELDVPMLVVSRLWAEAR